MQVADPAADRLSFHFAKGARREQPRFLREVLPRKACASVRDVRQALVSDDIVVTGEHGDQLFGSLKAMDIGWSELEAPWRESLPRELRARLASAYRSDVLVDWLEPQVRCAPVPVRSLWDLLGG